MLYFKFYPRPSDLGVLLELDDPHDVPVAWEPQKHKAEIAGSAVSEKLH